MRDSRTLLFEYTVEHGDTDPDGISFPANALSLNGATIKESGSERNAVITNSQITSRTNHRIDGGLELDPAQISSLGLLHGATAIDLTPTFAVNTTDYTAIVPTTVESLTIEVGTERGTTYTISPTDASNVDSGHQVQLTGTETVVTVTAQRPPRPDGVYTLTITKGTIQAEVSIESSVQTVAFHLDSFDFTVTRSPVTVAALDGAD